MREDVKKNGGDLIKMLSGTAKDLSDRIDADRPPAALNASVEFSFYSNEVADFPIKVKSMNFSPTGTLVIDFTGRNTSTVAANGLELWVNICTECTYAKEPEMFEKLRGQDEHLRHRVFGALNAGVFINEMTVEISPTRPGLKIYEISLRYACSNCGVVTDWQSIRVFVP